MSEYSELQVALINARDGYEKRRSNFTDPKDKRIHKRQCDLISAHIMDLPELARLQSEVERLLGRVAQLEVATLTAVQAMPGGQAKADLRDAYDEDTPATAWLLRKQAEAVEDWLHGDADMGDLADYAARLRQQADELEKAGGDDE